MYRARVGILLLFVGWEGCGIMVVVGMVGYETETSSFLFYFEDKAGQTGGGGHDGDDPTWECMISLAGPLDGGKAVCPKSLRSTSPACSFFSLAWLGALGQR